VNIQEVRQQYPQYKDLSDDQLGRALHGKFYSDMPYETFATKVGIRPEKPLKIGAEGLPEAIAETSKGFSAPSKFAIGAAGAINSAAMRLKQLATGLTPEDEQGVKEYRALEQASPAALAGDIGMNLAATATPGAALQRGATALASKVTPRFLAPAVGAAGTGAAITAATEPVLQGESGAEKALYGAAGGALGDVAARGLSRVAQPIQQSDAVKTLLKEGIVPTPGQAAGAKSFLGRFEQRLESLPILGDIITRGRTRAIDELNRAAVNASLPEKAKINVVGRKAIEEARDIFDSAYRNALGNKDIPINASKLQNAVAAVKSDPDVFLTKEAEANLDKLVEQFLRRMPSGKTHMTGEAAKSADSWLGGIAARYNKSPNAADRELGSAVLGLQKAFRSEIAAVVPELKGIDTKYASFLRVQRAAGATGSKEGIFSPEALQSSVRAMDKSRGGFASGRSVMQNLSDPAVDVLGRSVADSGTAGRALVGVGLLGAGGMANEYYGGPGYLTALALAPALYSRAGSRFLVGDYPGQQTLADLARRTAPYASQVGRAVTQ
jgi:hypothetical protein